MANRRPIFYEGKLGHYFRDLRKKHGWSLRRAVSVAGQNKLPVSLGPLKWLEGGLTKNPEPALLRALSVLYGEPYGNVVQEVARHVFDIRLNEPPHDDALPASMEGFVAVPLLTQPIAAKQPLLLEPTSGRDSSVPLRKEAVKKLTRPIGLRVGLREEGMAPTVQPGDVVVIDQNIERRRHPEDGRLYVVNLDALEGHEHGGAITRIETSDGILILTSDNPDTTQYPARAFIVKGKNLPEILVGEVVWIGRTTGTR